MKVKLINGVIFAYYVIYGVLESSVCSWEYVTLHVSVIGEHRKILQDVLWSVSSLCHVFGRC
jgi:hypothetical protein